MIVETLPRPDRDGRRQLVDVLARAFRDNPMNVAIHGPRPRHRIRANRAGLRALVEDTAPTLEARVCLDRERLVGGFVLAPPEIRVLPPPTLPRQLGCLWHQGARAMDRWGRVAAAFSHHRPLLPHWYLAVLGVEPVAQGRGFGSRLLRALLAERTRLRTAEQTEDETAPVYLECDRPESVAFYRHHGFELLHEVELEGVPCWGLGYGFPPTR
jgi:GNAT superfamily N-acetyltransferase